MKFKLENLNTHTRTKITKINGLKMYLKQIKYKTKGGKHNKKRLNFICFIELILI